MIKKYAIPNVKDSCSKKISKRNLFWERNPYASPGVNESLKSSEASIWILLLCELRLKSLEPSSVMARRRMPRNFIIHKTSTLNICFALLFYCLLRFAHVLHVYCLYLDHRLLLQENLLFAAVAI
jgi:hypothetical protein